MKRKFKQGRSAIPPMSTQRSITANLKYDLIYHCTR